MLPARLQAKSEISARLEGKFRFRCSKFSAKSRSYAHFQYLEFAIPQSAALRSPYGSAQIPGPRNRQPRQPWLGPKTSRGDQRDWGPKIT